MSKRVLGVVGVQLGCMIVVAWVVSVPLVCELMDADRIGIYCVFAWELSIEIITARPCFCDASSCGQLKLILAYLSRARIWKLTS